jgi:hypothetical protein
MREMPFRTKLENFKVNKRWFRYDTGKGKSLLI